MRRDSCQFFLSNLTWKLSTLTTRLIEFWSIEAFVSVDFCFRLCVDLSSNLFWHHFSKTRVNCKKKSQQIQIYIHRFFFTLISQPWYLAWPYFSKSWSTTPGQRASARPAWSHPCSASDRSWSPATRLPWTLKIRLLSPCPLFSGRTRQGGDHQRRAGCRFRSQI